MKILVIGGGGREHALAWKLAQSPKVQQVYVAPGNGGTAQSANLKNVPITDLVALRDWGQAYAEGAVTRAVEALQTGKRPPLQAGVVVTDVRRGPRRRR